MKFWNKLYFFRKFLLCCKSDDLHYVMNIWVILNLMKLLTKIDVLNCGLLIFFFSTTKMIFKMFVKKYFSFIHLNNY